MKTLTERPASTTDTITLDKTVKAHYVRLYINASDAKDPDSGGSWNSISVYEMEVYGGTPAVSMGDIGNMITVETPKADSDKLSVNLPEVEGYTVTYNGTDLEQVIDSDLKIYHPVVDKTVNVSFKIVKKGTDDQVYEFKEIPVTVPDSIQKQRVTMPRRLFCRNFRNGRAEKAASQCRRRRDHLRCCGFRAGGTRNGGRLSGSYREKT